MSTQAPTARTTPVQTTASDRVTFGPVHLNVVDPARSLAFWRDLVGLRPVHPAGGDDDGGMHLGVSDAELLVLHPGATRPVAPGHTGIYHLAIHLPSEAEFARVLARLFTARYPHAPTDHVMHWATYLDDPDGIGLELTFETRDRFGRYDLDGARPTVIDAQGRRRDGVAALDLDEVFRHLPDDDLTRPLPGGTRVGHIHLHVAELSPAVRFFEAVGFTHGLTLPVGMAELHAQGTFPHRLALNIWQGVGAPPPPDGVAGLRHAVLRLRGTADVSAAIGALRALGAPVQDDAGDATAVDPSGNRVTLTTGG